MYNMLVAIHSTPASLLLLLLSPSKLHGIPEFETSNPGFSTIKNLSSMTPDGRVGLCGTIATMLLIVLISIT